MDTFFGSDSRYLEVGSGYFGCGDPPGPTGHCLSASAEWRLNRSGLEDNTKILKEIYDRSVNLCNSFCDDDAPFNENDKRGLDDGSDSEFRAKDVSPEISSSFHRELLNKSIGSMENILSRNTRDHVRDLNACGDQPDSQKASRGVRLNPQASVCQYDTLSSEDEERIERYKENRAVVMHNDTHRSAMARIEDMWDMFAVNDYAPWSEFREDLKQKRSQSLSRIDAGASKYPNTPSVWKKKTTIPKPPSMLLRDANRIPRKTKAMIELDQQIEEKKQLEDLECKKQFRATPAPDHVRLRLFEELNQQQEERRKFLRENGEEILKSLQQPFEFSKREEMKKLEKMRDLRKGDRKKSDGHFHARPFPSHIFNGTVEDKILEEKEYRQIRMRMRAEELLNSFIAPYSMRMQNWRKVEPRHRKTSDDDDAMCTFHPKVNQTFPDLDDQYQRFVEQMIRCKRKRQPTTCRPFNLRLSKPRRAHDTASRHGTSAKVSRYEAETTGDYHVASFDMSSSQQLMDRKPSKFDLGERQRPTGRKKSMPKKTGVEMAADMGVVEDFDNITTKNSRRRSEAGLSLPMYKKVEKFGTDIVSKEENFLNRTYDLDNPDPRGSSLTSDNAGSDLWCHPSIVKRSQFWSNPVAIIK